MTTFTAHYSSILDLVMGKKKDKDRERVSAEGEIGETADAHVDVSAKQLPQQNQKRDITGKVEYAEACKYLNAIAQPLASRKLAKKLYKLIRKASKEKGCLRRGIADVQRSMRKGQTGLMILAGDVTPVDVYTHVPAVCEAKDIPYVFTPSRFHLALSAGVKRPTIMLLVVKHDDYAGDYEECEQAIKMLPLPAAEGAAL